MIQLAVILVYSGKPRKAITWLLKAEQLVDGQSQPYLAFAVASGLANAYSKTGLHSAAKEQLLKAKGYLSAADHPLGVYELQYIEGFLEARHGDPPTAVALLTQARLGFREAENMIWIARVNLDLALLHTHEDEWSRVLALASEAVPMLESLRLSRETLGAVELHEGLKYVDDQHDEGWPSRLLPDRGG